MELSRPTCYPRRRRRFPPLPHRLGWGVILLGFISAFAAAAACSKRERPPVVDSDVGSPAPPGSHEPNLTLDPDGQALLSWIESRAEGGHALRFAALAPSRRWSEPRTIAAGSDWFVNWADFPSIAALPDRSLVAHWLIRSGEGKYDYDVQLSRSTDGGEIWSEPSAPYAAGGGGEHGFVSLVPRGRDELDVVWLDGRNVRGGEGDTQLRHARIGPGGQPGTETILDPRVCDCCQTSAARAGDNLIVVYRDRSDGENRDISAVRLVGDRWESPRPVSRDGWEIHGCPVNGPAVDAEGERVAVAWFTGAGEKGAVRLAFSADAGASWGEPVKVDDGQPLGRVDLAILPEGGALVSWMEEGGDAVQIRVRRVQPEGRLEPSIVVASSSGERSSGFPRIVRAGRELIVAWTAAGDPAQVRVTSVSY